MALAPDRLAELDAFLLELNRASADVILPLFRADHGLENKLAGTGFDPVTEADKGAERAIRKLINERYPTHGIIGEEYGAENEDAEFVWILDPVDGTRAFIAGIPLWTTLIGLWHEGEPVLGSIGQPYLEEVFIGGPATGSRLIAKGTEAKLQVRACEKLTDAVIATTDTIYLDGPELGSWTQVRAAARMGRFGCDAYAFALLAAGRIDLVMEPKGMKVWDVEAAVAVVEGAGGLACNWRGERVGRKGGQVVMAGDQRVLDEALVTLRRSAQ
jgi:histidinol phosphatase-like enzyme (inositol monophosphatase family)